MRSEGTPDESQVRHVCRYYVDEAGDPVLFDSKGRIRVGTEGCSRYFAVGLLEVDDPGAPNRHLKDLRHRLLVDPYFRNVPSMQPAQRKTAVAFHAKDDLPEVRREVFTCLLEHQLRFIAVVRDKRAVLNYVRQRNERDRTYRYNHNELYDLTVSRLFKGKLHKAEEYVITFARRGKSDRTASLSKALEVARKRFRERWGIVSSAAVRIEPAWARESTGLQATDYFLWAVQRLFERGEDRFLRLLWPRVSMIQDVDDTTQAGYGVYYTDKNPPGTSAGRWGKGI